MYHIFRDHIRQQFQCLFSVWQPSVVYCFQSERSSGRHLQFRHPSYLNFNSISVSGRCGTLQVSHLFPVELTYAKIGNSLLLKRYFSEIAGVCIVFRTLGTQAKKQLSRKIILVETSHVPYFSIL